MLPVISASLSSTNGLGTPTVLVVEDEPLIRLFVTEVLQDGGCHVLEAGTVAQAKRCLANTKVDLVFSDVNMPGGEDGFALEKWVRRNYPDMKMLLTSGGAHAAEATRNLREPMLPKPYSCETFVRRIQDILHSKVTAG